MCVALIRLCYEYVRFYSTCEHGDYSVGISVIPSIGLDPTGHGSGMLDPFRSCTLPQTVHFWVETTRDSGTWPSGGLVHFHAIMLVSNI